MKCLTWNHFKTVFHKLFVFCESRSSQYLVATVIVVVEQWMSDVFHVYPDLMGSSGFKSAFHQINIAKSLNHTVMCNGRFPMFSFRKYRKNLSVFQASAYIPSNSSFVVFEIAPNQCNIFPFGRFFKEL